MWPALPSSARQIEKRILPALPRNLACQVKVDQILVLDLLHLLDHRRGKRPQSPARLDQHRLRDRQREREVRGERRSLSGNAGDVDASAQRGDVRANDVHSDAASGDLGHCAGGRKSRGEDEFDELSLGRLDVAGDQALRARLVADPSEIESCPVVGQLDRDFVALLADVERYFAGFLLARIPPRLTALDAMVERIAQQVLERSDQLFQHRTIELDLRAAYLEIRAFVELLRRLAKNAVETLRQAAEGNRADREQLLLHVARKPRLRQQRRVGLVEVLQQRLLNGRNVVDAFGEALASAPGTACSGRTPADRSPPPPR